MLQLYHALPELFGERLLAAEKHYPCFFARKPVSLVKIIVKKAHKSIYLFLGALPVFGGKRKESGILYSPVSAGVHYLAEIIGSRLMTRRTWKATLSSPSSVAVHYKSHMSRNICSVFRKIRCAYNYTTSL